jgi:hypothetical protein
MTSNFAKPGRKRRYPIPEWSKDRRWHKVRRGVHFGKKTKLLSAQAYLYGAAGEIGMKATVEVVDNDTLRVRFYIEGEAEAKR